MLKDSDFVKIRVAVPLDHADKIRKVLGEAGAGIQGNYKFASGSWKQTGRFLPTRGANPTVGKIGNLEEVPEEVIETLCHVDKVRNVIEAVENFHPYEEPAIDVIPRLDVI
ncbi:MAG: hypothetical protein COT91_05150 [Candidatus Doudnabacteria bacterium CG10_big_fil_rev_8_21_14_0_10_41_10]|uniref:Cytochrome C biogenesis protein n=1 Tax=Candidatus Doudnabacteria bacterium CG10_big_fil_rev_8_21_14_0_10_41_10 TaxID=1974551 RepID=A0A2H0VEM2_9BACT|nr:MAG: hypothetical protein COT91_05150 [Candidatus Doudnabacteria bacterium CG10_big_fil_rev_8_21_14_0_10_41_10]